MVGRSDERTSPLRPAALLLSVLAASAVGALVAGGSALAQGPNVSGTWSSVYHCASGYCAGETFADTLTLTQAPDSNAVNGSDNIGGHVAGTLSGSTLTLTETDRSYTAYFTVTISADGRSWSGKVTDSNGTSGTDTATLAVPPAPGPPVLGKTVNATPVSGVVFIKLPGGRASDGHGDEFDDALSKGQGFIPLTQARQIPSGSQIDARRGTLNLFAAPAAKHGKLERVTLSGAIFTTTQSATGLSKGLTTLSLLEGDFPGAPTYASCPKPATDSPTAQAAKASPKVLQTLKASDNHGHFRTKGRYSSASVIGTVWTTSDRCDGTLTTVKRGTVDVYNFGTRRTIPLHAGYSYLAKAYTTAY